MRNFWLLRKLGVVGLKSNAISKSQLLVPGGIAEKLGVFGKEDLDTWPNLHMSFRQERVMFDTKYVENKFLYLL